MTTRMGTILRQVSALPALLARAEGGAAAVYVALALPAFVGAGGLAVDVASWYSTQRTMQSGADAAAYAAALELARQGLDQAPDLTAMQAVADDAASRNGVGTAVTLNMPPLSGPAAGDPQAVEVIVTEPGAALLHRPVPRRGAVDHDPCRRQGGGVRRLHLGAAPERPRRRSASRARPSSISTAAWWSIPITSRRPCSRPAIPACPPHRSASPAATPAAA